MRDIDVIDPTRLSQVQASRAAMIKLLSTLDEGEYLGRPIRHMYGRVVMYDCTRRAYAMVRLHMERIRAGVLQLAVDIRAVRAAPQRDCDVVADVMALLPPPAAAVAAFVSLAVALAAIQRKRSTGHSTVRFASNLTAGLVASACIQWSQSPHVLFCIHEMLSQTSNQGQRNTCESTHINGQQ